MAMRAEVPSDELCVARRGRVQRIHRWSTVVEGHAACSVVESDGSFKATGQWRAWDGHTAPLCRKCFPDAEWTGGIRVIHATLLD